MMHSPKSASTEGMSPEKPLALRPPREYEFLVTTEQPHQAEGNERRLIRQKVMKNFFEAQEAGPKSATSETNSVSTVQAKTKLKSRFRLSKVGQDSTAAKSKGGNGNTTQRSNQKKTKKIKSEEQTISKISSSSRLSESGPDSTRTSCSLSPVEKSDYIIDNIKEWESEGSPFGLDVHRMDPFDVLPVPNTTKLELLFQLYKSGTTLTSVNINCIGTWWPFVASDAGLLHATLASWALYGVLMRGAHQVLPDMLSHRNEAIKEINTKINTSNGWISDELVGNVLILATFENLYGEYDSALLHFGALKRMIDVRGGLDSFNHNGGIFRGIVWVDYHNAVALRRPSVFPLVLLEPISPPLPQDLLDEATQNSPLSLLQLPVSPVECFNIFHQLHRLALATSSYYAPTVDRLTFSNQLYELEYNILSTIDYSLDLDSLIRDVDGPRLLCYSRDSPESEASDNDYAAKHRLENEAALVTEAVLVSAQIFIGAAMRDIPSSAKLYLILLKRLRGAIDRPGVSIIKTWKELNNLNILLWALAVGACVAPRNKRLWWVEKVAEVMKELGIEGLDGLEGMLRGIAWTDYTFAKALRGVWVQVEALTSGRA